MKFVDFVLSCAFTSDIDFPSTNKLDSSLLECQGCHKYCCMHCWLLMVIYSWIILTDFDLVANYRPCSFLQNRRLRPHWRHSSMIFPLSVKSTEVWIGSSVFDTVECKKSSDNEQYSFFYITLHFFTIWFTLYGPL